MSDDQQTQEPLETSKPNIPTQEPEETFGLRFHAVPLLIALALTTAFYIFIFLFVDTSGGPLGRP